ncbi:ribokinase [Mycoplasma todarodis]|uniref:Ribokinase n=1 Tax=Mycoplasma todarodis TaxID=1937191 RepID=A0A4R0XNT4_9MOLU|nr:ribokinase [Mycoplasma todarodis]TCG11162.1 ribokinase [Mycoplasma todarodis]
MNLLVVGSINIDYVNYVYEFPKKGETIMTADFLINNGGKGANQALAAKRLSRENNKVSLFAKVGKRYGGDIVEYLKDEGIDTKYISYSDEKTTGMATITVSQTEKDNMIIINGGANHDFSEKDLDDLTAAIEESDVVLMQLETNNWLLDHTVEIAHKLGKKIILNPSPAMSFKQEWIDKIEWLVLNETELEYVSNQKVNNLEDVVNASEALRARGCKNIITTLGANGVALSMDGVNEHFKSRKITTVDTTAAGDTFVGAFVEEYYNTNNIQKAIKFGMRAAEVTISRLGAQKSIPTLDKVEKESR